MNYCIVIKFTRSEISFRYNRDDDPQVSNRLVPIREDEPVLPLALYIGDNRVEFSANARVNAASGVAGYYDGILDRLGSEQRFTVAGKEYSMAQLLMVAIEHRLREFYSNILLGALGTLDENRAAMPLSLIIDYSVPANVHSRIINLFHTGGYNAVNEIKEFPLLLNQAQSVGTQDSVMVVNVAGDDLYCHIYRRGDADVIHADPIAGAGRDLRIDRLATELWNDVHYEDTRAVADVEMPQLRQLAAKFIKQGVREIYDEPYTTAGGRRCYLNVDKTFIANLNVAGGDMSLVNAVGQVLNIHHVNPAGCVMFLTGGAADEYVMQALKSYYTVYGQDTAMLDRDVLRLAYEHAGSNVIITSRPGQGPTTAVMAGKAEDVARILSERLATLQPLKARIVADGMTLVNAVTEAVETATEILSRTPERYIRFEQYAAKFDEAREALNALATPLMVLAAHRRDHDDFTASMSQALGMAQQFSFAPEVKQLMEQLQSARTQIEQTFVQVEQAKVQADTCRGDIARLEQAFPQYRALRDRIDHAGTSAEKDAIWQQIEADRLTLEPCPIPTSCSLTGHVEITKSGFMGMKKTRTLHVDIEVHDGKTIPFETVLVAQDKPLVTIDRSRAFVADLGSGLSGLRHEQFPLPLPGCNPSATKLYIYLKPVEGLNQNTLISCPALTITL